jgi:hypothetical protein
LFFLCIHSYPHTTSLVTHHSSSQSPPWRDSTQTLPKVFYSCSNIFVHQLSPAWRASTQTLPKVFYSCSNIFVHQLSPAWRASTQTPQRYFIHVVIYSCTNSHLRGVLPPKPPNDILFMHYYIRAPTLTCVACFHPNPAKSTTHTHWWCKDNIFVQRQACSSVCDMC